MSAIDHAAEARRFLDALHWQSEEDQPGASVLNVFEAQVHATLDVAEQTAQLAAEQRTANLIARWATLRSPTVGVQQTSAVWGEIERLDREIHARLLPVEDVTG